MEKWTGWDPSRWGPTAAMPDSLSTIVTSVLVLLP
jgi:hypothetical protein